MTNFLALEASAGAGKTYGLAIRFIALFLREENLSSILAITFTNKATSEMKERIIDFFSNITKNEKKYNEIRRLIAGELIDSKDENLEEKIKAKEKEIIEKCQKDGKLYNTFMSGELQIKTFDSFFTSILRQFAAHKGISPNFATGTNIDDEILLAFSEDASDEELKEFAHFSKQIDISSESLFPMFERLARVEFKPLDISFPNYNLKDDYENLRNLFPKIPALKIENENSNKSINDAILQRMSLKTFQKFQDDPNAAPLIELLKEKLAIYYKEFEQNAFYRLNKLLKLYLDTKSKLISQTNIMNYSDVVYLVYKMLTKDKVDTKRLYFRLDSELKNILIDEFQDTSVEQYKIMYPLIEEIVSGQGTKDNRSFFYVGDIKQSIYKFRDAKKELFNKLQKDFPQIQTDSLKYNYRSAKNVVDFINKTFSDNENIKSLGFSYEPQIPNKEHNGMIEICSFDGSKEARKDNEDFKNTLVQKVKFLLDSGVKESDIGILCWKNSDINLIKEILENEEFNGNPIKVANSSRTLLDIVEIRLVLEYLKYCIFGDEIYSGALELVLGKKMPKLNLDFRDIANSLKYLAKKLELNEFDKNLLKLYEISSKYEDIIDFIISIEKNPPEEENIQRNGINILTVHKSKGLQFQSLIICDALGGTNNEKDKIITNYDEEKDIWEVRLRQKNLELVDESYAKLQNRLKLIDKVEIINELYVAITRAEDNLFILVKDGADGKSPSYFRAYESNKILIEYLDLKDYKEGELSIKKDEIKEDSQTSNIKIQAFEKSQSQELIEEEKIEFAQNLEKIYFGDALHFGLENLDFRAYEKSLDLVLTLVKNKFGALLEASDLEDIKNRISNLMSNDEFMNLLENKEILKEQSVVIDNKLKRFDLLLIGKNEIIVLDYKSGEKSDEYKKQIDEYKEILGILYPDKKILGKIIYLEKNVVEIENL